MKYSYLNIFGLIMLLVSPISDADFVPDKQICNTFLPESTPTSHFEIQQDQSTVLHKTTRLLWQRCLLGQTFENGKCLGEADIFFATFGSAIEKIVNDKKEVTATIVHKNFTNLENYFNKNPGWRLPNEKEMLSIREMRCYAPDLNAEIFVGHIPYERPMNYDNFRIIKAYSWKGSRNNINVPGYKFRLVKSMD